MEMVTKSSMTLGISSQDSLTATPPSHAQRRLRARTSSVRQKAAW